MAATETTKAARVVASPAPARLFHRATLAAAVVLIPLGAGVTYFSLGSPNLVPVSMNAVGGELSPVGIEKTVAEVETYLENNPRNGQGWELLAPVYLRLGRFDDAVKARKQALRLNGATARREADLGEAETAAANGVVTAEARASFEHAVALDPKEAKARYFLGLAAEQDGRNDDAAALWRSMLAEAPNGAPWIGLVRQALGRVSGGAVANNEPSAGDILAAADMSTDARRDMIHSMVARLADRLRINGADVEGWLRLVRAYVVLGDRDKAKQAATEAKRALGERPDDVRRVDDLVKDLGIEG